MSAFFSHWMQLWELEENLGSPFPEKLWKFIINMQTEKEYWILKCHWIGGEFAVFFPSSIPQPELNSSLNPWHAHCGHVARDPGESV